MSIRKLVVAVTLAALTVAPVAAADAPADVGQRGLEDLVKLRCSTDPGDEVIVWWTGVLYGLQEQQAPKPLLGFEGYNICRSQEQADGSWQLLTRELTFYRDLVTGEIVDDWDNPYSQSSNSVVHVANDPVNTAFRAGGPSMPWLESGNTTMLSLNIPLAYPNPLSPAEFPRASSGEMYVGSEHFMFSAPREQMDDPSLSQVDTHVGWTRVGPWLPWMEMGGVEGRLLYVGQGNKKASIEDMPADIQERIQRDYPEYARAPSEWVQPNMTSWTYYKRLRQEADGKN